MNFIQRNIQNNTFYLLLSKPGVYLQELLWRTLLIGAVAYGISFSIIEFHLEKLVIPSSMHSLVGIVIGLLLVFRTNTAYDRWWDGRKTIGVVSQEISMISIRLNLIIGHDEEVKSIRVHLDTFLKTLCNYLQSGDDGTESEAFHIEQTKSIQAAMRTLKSIKQNDFDVVELNKSIAKLLDYSNSLERIKNTPIPLSYMLHIKMSILIYLMTLPFGMFHELGLWGTPLVMLVYYIIAGVEIISNEIENPFADDPNDLPTAKLFEVINKSLWTRS